MSQENETAVVSPEAVAAGMTVKDGVLHGKNGTPIGKVAADDPKTDPKSKSATPKKAAANKPKAAAAKPTPKKADTATVAPKGRSVGETDKTPAQRRMAVIKAMRGLGAVSATTSVTADRLATKCGMTRFDVYGQLYHTNHLQRDGFVKQVQMEGVRGLSYHLTAKGQKTDPE